VVRPTPVVSGTEASKPSVIVSGAEAGDSWTIVSGTEVVRPTPVVSGTEASKPSVVVSGAEAGDSWTIVSGTEVIRPTPVVPGTGTSKPSVVIAGAVSSGLPVAVTAEGAGTSPVVVADRGEGGAPGTAENTGTAGLPSAATSKPQGPRETVHVTVSPNVEIRPTSVKEKSGEVAVFTAKEPVMTFVPQYPRWSAPAVPPQFPQNHYHRFIQDDIDAELDMVNLFTLPRTAPGTQIARVDDAFGAQRQAGEQLLPEKHRRSYDASDFGLTGGLFSISALNFTKASAMGRTAS
jgi:hypothetical protein